MKGKFSEAMRKFSGAVIVPVKFMAIMGLFLALSVILQLKFMPDFVQSFGQLIKTMMDSMLNNLSLIFCVGIAAALAKHKKVEAAIVSLIAFLLFLAANNAWLSMNGMLAEEGAVGLYGTGQGVVLGFQVVDMNVFLGMILGCLVGYLHNRFSNKEFHDIFSIYGGTRLTFMILTPIILVLAVVLCYVWPVINSGINSLTGIILTTGLFGVFIYAFGNRFLVPTGLHHLLWMPFCFTALGGSAQIGGKIYNGAVNIFYAQMANPESVVQLDASLRFATFGFAKIFGSVAVALAIIYCADKKKKKEVKGMLLPSMFVGIMAGITEPLDFSFLFVSPLLWLVHGLLAAISETILWALNARTYMLFGVIDSLVSNSVFSPSVTKVYIVILVGLIMGAVWFFTFVFLIKKLDIKTPGRETDSGEAEEAQSKQEAANDGVAVEQEIIAGLGGAENIDAVTNCFTRLRITVKDMKKVDKEKLEQLKKVKGVVLGGSEAQIIIGMGVQKLKDNIIAILGLAE